MRLLALLAFATCLLGQSSNFRIISPTPDSVFRPGDTVDVAIETRSTYESVHVLAFVQSDNVEPGEFTAELVAPAYRTTLRMPSTPRASEVRLLFAAMRKPGDTEMEGVRIFIRPDYRKESDSGDAVQDDPGITVDLRSNPVMHRSPVHYPAALRERGIAGTVVVEVTPDWEGYLDGRFALSGPPELRRHAVLAVGDWHFAPEYGDHSPTGGHPHSTPTTHTSRKPAPSRPVARLWLAQPVLRDDGSRCIQDGAHRSAWPFPGRPQAPRRPAGRCSRALANAVRGPEHDR